MVLGVGQQGDGRNTRERVDDLIGLRTSPSFLFLKFGDTSLNSPFQLFVSIAVILLCYLCSPFRRLFFSSFSAPHCVSDRVTLTTVSTLSSMQQ